MIITDDPAADFARHDAEQEAWLAKLPVCYECGHPVQDEHCYLINDEVVCQDCLENYHKKRVEDFLD